MKEKRFYELASSIDYYQIWDKQEDKGYTIEDAVDKLNELAEENKYLKKRIKVISDELYCKDRKLEELGVPIECCDKK